MKGPNITYTQYGSCTTCDHLCRDDPNDIQCKHPDVEDGEMWSEDTPNWCPYIADRIMVTPVPPQYLEVCQNRYGDKRQIDITIEELSELSTSCTRLIQQICKLSRQSDDVIRAVPINPLDTAVFDNFIEELADVRIMTDQIIYTKALVKFVNREIEGKLKREEY